MYGQCGTKQAKNTLRGRSYTITGRKLENVNYSLCEYFVLSKSKYLLVLNWAKIRQFDNFIAIFSNNMQVAIYAYFTLCVSYYFYRQVASYLFTSYFHLQDLYFIDIKYVSRHWFVMPQSKQSIYPTNELKYDLLINYIHTYLYIIFAVNTLKLYVTRDGCNYMIRLTCSCLILGRKTS